MALSDIDSLPAGALLGAASYGLRNIVYLGAFFGGRKVVAPTGFFAARAAPAAPVSAWLGWGNRRSGQAARRRAAADNVPFALLEDGFIRSIGLGKTGAPPVSLVIDDIGIYYDAGEPSRLERLIGSAGCNAVPALEEARQALGRWRSERLTKYNTGADLAPPALRNKIILVDQVRGDASVAGAGADVASFQAMAIAALARHDRQRLVVLTHPDVRAGKARGCLCEIAAGLGLEVLALSLSPQAVLDVAAEIWTVSSGLGFEALLRGVPVTCFAMPFYAGWGLTEDRAQGVFFEAARQRRSARPTVEALFGAAMLRYARYADPVTQRMLDFHGAVDRLVDWRTRDCARGSAPTCAFGFAPWKRAAAKAFLGSSGAPVQFWRKSSLRALRTAGQEQRIAVWGMTDQPGFAQAVLAGGHNLLRVEDGFLRSVGLGSDLLAPGSLVLDDLGIYYDARQESRLERILATHDFGPQLLTRAAALRERLCRGAVTKYNLASEPVDLRRLAGGRAVALVAEQVPGDASLRFGGGNLAGNLALLQAVRSASPGSFLVYKEHPDLVAGNRRGRLLPQHIAPFADLVLSRGDMAGLFLQIDALHVISSLAGFEALLRGVAVSVWGRPFYAGWGLTLDHMALPRRSRRLTLDELVAGTLITYPLYAAPLNHVPCSVEDFLTALEGLRDAGHRPMPVTGVTGQLRRLRRWLAAALRQV